MTTADNFPIIDQGEQKEPVTVKYIIFRPLAILLMGITYLISQFVDHPVLPTLVSIFALITLILFLKHLSKVPRILISTLLVLTVILFATGDGLLAMVGSFGENAGILAIFIFVPLISIPITNGRYLDEMNVLFQAYIRKTGDLYAYLQASALG